MNFAVFATLLVLVGTAYAGPVLPNNGSIIDIIRDELRVVEDLIRVAEKEVDNLAHRNATNVIERYLLLAVETLLQRLEARVEDIERLLGQKPKELKSLKLNSLKLNSLKLNPLEILAKELVLIEDVIIDVEERVEAVRQNGSLGPVINTAIEAFESVLRLVEQAVEGVETLLGGGSARKVAPSGILDLVARELQLVDHLIVDFEGQVERLENETSSEVVRAALNVVDTLLHQVAAVVEEVESLIDDNNGASSASLKTNQGPIDELLNLVREALERLEGAIQSVELAVRNVAENAEINFVVRVALQALDSVLQQLDNAVGVLERALFN